MHTSATDGVEYVDFTDPINGLKYRFNTTFFLSRYRCTWGEGCVGCDNVSNHGCCNIGAHIADETECNYVQKYIDKLTPDQWENHGEVVWEDVEDEEDGKYKTVVTDQGVCVMNNSADHTFPGCALHVGAIQAGEDFRDWKPEACWMYPIHIDPLEEDTWLVGPVWRANHWSGANVGWWCIDDVANYINDGQFAFQFFGEELVRMTSQQVYDMFTDWCVARLDGRIAKITAAHGKPLNGRNGRINSTPVTLTRKD